MEDGEDLCRKQTFITVRTVKDGRVTLTQFRLPQLQYFNLPQLQYIIYIATEVT